MDASNRQFKERNFFLCRSKMPRIAQRVLFFLPFFLTQGVSAHSEGEKGVASLNDKKSVSSSSFLSSKQEFTASDGSGEQKPSQHGDWMRGFTLKLLYPPHRQDVFGPIDGSDEFFRWDFSHVTADVTYIWVLQDTSGKNIRRVYTDQKYVKQRIKPGHYKWYVEALVRNVPPFMPPMKKILSHASTEEKNFSHSVEIDRFLKIRLIRSRPRKVQVIGDSHALRQDKLLDILSSSAQRSIFMSDGL